MRIVGYFNALVEASVLAKVDYQTIERYERSGLIEQGHGYMDSI